MQIALGTISFDEKMILAYKSTSKEVLSVLATDDIWRIRLAVANNVNTPKKVLEELSNDENNLIRNRVIKNPNVPKEIVEKLLKDPDKVVRRAAQIRWENENGEKMTVKEFQVQYALGTLTIWNKVKLAVHKYTAKKILTILSIDKDWYVRCQVAGNPNTPIKILKVLSKDVNGGVRIYVRDNPNTPKEIVKNMKRDS